jgi:hypothetical protein
MSKIRESARGEACTLRLDGCNGGVLNETVVYCHLGGAGMGQKSHDIHGFFGCHSCHNIVDGRKNHNYESNWLDHMVLRAVINTQERLIEKGLI